MTLIEQLELLAKTQPTPFDVHWADEARRLATWAAVTLVASNSALEAEQRRVSELEALLREWVVRDRAATNHGYGIDDELLTQATMEALGRKD